MKRIGRYQIEDKLGEGASGVVFRAHDPVMDRQVAIKSVKSESMTDEEIKHALSEFHHEAAIAGKYAHENIVGIYDVIQYGRLDYIVMEFVPGRSILDYMIAVGPMGIDETLAVVHKCCIGLAYIHYHGVIHRDIKPGNIMYHPANGIAKLTDFSISQSIEEPSVKDTGTIAYMAPEHFDPDREITQLTDIFAMGSTMYRMLAKKYPFNKDNTIHQILNKSPVSIRELRPDVPKEVSDIVDKAMAKSDVDRFQSAAKFAIEVENVMNKLYPNSTLMNNSKEYMLI
ncbi:MAG: serine/threonine protein kinase [Gammaproteobacteria bacterium]|jgi:eukaryotic-like serine/threonine-protein kinase|nr:serine/threonine protein kinase [Gammaproteobacteria bacterium]